MADVSKENIRSFLDAKVSEGKCPICGHDRWTLFSETNNRKPALIIMGENYEMYIKPPTVPIIVLICQNCGFIRLHSKKVFDQYFSGKNEPLDVYDENPD